jgi:hypothetical protein
MTCCIVGFVILAAVGRIRRLLGRAEEPMLFAPVAQRPAPGQTLMAVAPVADPRPESPVLRYCAVGIAICLIGTPALVFAGAAQNTGPTWMWLVRSAVYLAVIVATLRLGRSLALWSAPPGAATLLIIVGAVIFELGVLDMHIFRLFDLDSNLLAYMVFHNIGPAVATAGGLVLLYGSLGRRTTSRRPSRSTLTSALPSSPAVTLSSTPPITT